MIERINAIRVNTLIGAISDFLAVRPNEISVERIAKNNWRVSYDDPTPKIGCIETFGSSAVEAAEAFVRETATRVTNAVGGERHTAAWANDFANHIIEEAARY